MNIVKKLFIGLLLFSVTFSLLNGNLAAMNLKSVEVTCPIDGSVFKFNDQTTSTVYLRYMDYEPYGSGKAPDPLPKCPSNGFVIYKPWFTKEEIEVLREFVASKVYRDIVSEHTNYYLAARLQEVLNEDLRGVAWTLLQATWEASNQQYDKYASEALLMYKKSLKQQYPDKSDWYVDQYLAGELERRLGKFVDAKERFMMLKNQPGLGHLLQTVSLQLTLIDRKDAKKYLPGQVN